jgi:hypothetical protein
MHKIRVVQEWALKVLEFGPQGARRDATRFLEEVEVAMRRGGEVGGLLDELAEDALDLCLGNLIQAPPGLHGRLLGVEEYRNRLEHMRRI